MTTVPPTDAGLAHESPTALGVRPTVAIRQIPGAVIRLPARGATILLIATLVWGASVAISTVSWVLLAALVLLPAGLLIALVELAPRGKPPLAWLVVLARHHRRPPQLSTHRVVPASPARAIRLGRTRLMRSPRSQASATVQQVLGIHTIGDGYVLRDDHVAVALVELTPPDLAAFDAAALLTWLDTAVTVLRGSGDRCALHTFAVPPDVRPLLRTLTIARDRAPDGTSFMVLHALADVLAQALPALARVPSVRWVLAVPSVAPDLPPRGTWGALAPEQIAPRPAPLPGDPVANALGRARRLAGALAALEIEPPPRLLRAHEIRVLLRLALDPVATLAHPDAFADEVRPLQVAAAVWRGGR